jgi:phospholipase/carboxylesterase
LTPLTACSTFDFLRSSWQHARLMTRIERMGGLEVAIHGGPDGRGGGDGPVVVLLHGFGAPGNDLVPLARVLALPSEVRWVFPAAPLPLEMPFLDARAWWMIDLERLERAVATGREGDFAREEPAGLAEANAHLIALLDEIQTRLGVGGERIVLGGFSQGAMLALDVAVRSNRRLAGLCLLSTTLLCEEVWTPILDRLRGTPVFQSHGTLDPLLPFGAAQRLRELMLTARVEVEWVAFRGGHELPGAVLDALRAFLLRVTGAPAAAG